MDLAVALSELYEEVDYSNFYRELFPEGELEARGKREKGKYHAVAISIATGEKKVWRYSIFDDLEDLDDLAASEDFCLMSPISYAGKSRKSEFARFLYAIAIDLDGVTDKAHFDYFLGQINEGAERPSANWALPKPTFLVSSGTGIHVYYFLDRPVPLFPNIVKQLEKMKRRLTWKCWTQGASELVENVQYESLFQGFRVVGTITKNGRRARAFRVGDKVNLELLNEYLRPEDRVTTFRYKSDLSLENAKKLYPEWYQRRVVEKKPRGTWTCKRDLYDWWKRRLPEVVQGHRYWFIMTMATYAIKCGISREELEKDALGMIPEMNKKGDPFTEEDVIHALEAFCGSYSYYPIKTIVNRTGLQIERNKRNYQKQREHLFIARGIRDLKNKLGQKVSGGGRPLKAAAIYEWRQQHPTGKKIDCERDTEISRPTIIKWWDWKPEDDSLHHSLHVNYDVNYDGGHEK